MAKKYAGFWIRFLASIIDSLILGPLSFVLGFLIWASVLSSDNFIQILLYDLVGSLILIFISLFYFSLLESSSLQGTIGKLAVGIKVIDLKGKRISFLRAVGRYLAKYLSILIFFIGFIMIAFTKKKQGLHDLIAETIVIKK